MLVRQFRLQVAVGFVFVAVSSTVLEAAPRDVQIRAVDLEASTIELFNFGNGDEPLDGWRFCSHNESRSRIYSSSTGLNGVSVEAGTSLFIHLNDDSPGGPDNINRSQVGSFTAIDRGPIAIGLYFPRGAFVNFGVTADIADFLQWNIDGATDPIADERTDEAAGPMGVWNDIDGWISTTEQTTKIVLTDETGAELHGVGDYQVLESEPPVEPDCNGNGVIDGDDIAAAVSQDIDGDGVPDECQPAKQNIQFASLDFAAGVIEISNLGSEAQTLDGWSICGSDEATIQLYTGDGGLNGVSMAPGASLFLHAQNDAPAEPNHLNLSTLGGDTLPSLDPGPYGLGLYFPGAGGFIDFDNGLLVADYLQWNVDGVNDALAGNRGDEAVTGGVWAEAGAWVVTSAETTRLVLNAAEGFLHGPDSYQAISAPAGEPVFHRGDATGEGTLELTDAVRIFGFLFLGGDAPSCAETADANNDAAVDLSDGVSVLNFLFQGGPPPASPGPVSSPCGPDPDEPGSPGDLGCESYAGCAAEG